MIQRVLVFALCLAVTIPLMVPTSKARADALFFPYVVASPAVATIISVVNKDPDGELFLNYLIKNSSAATASCTDKGRNQVDSATNDIVSFEANGFFVGSVPGAIGGPLFNDASVAVDYTGNNFTMGPIDATTRAILVVDDNDNDGEHLYGEALILETVGGAAWGYRAINGADDGGELSGGNAPEFDAPSDVLGEALDVDNGTDAAAVTLLPLTEWQTRFFVTPLSDGNQRCTNCNAAIKLTRDKGESALGVFDRDTTPYVGTSNEIIQVVCVHGVDLADLLPASVEAAIGNQGGWGYVNIDVGSIGGETSFAATVLKLEYNTVQFISPDVSKSFPGTVNTAVFLRNVDNTQGVSGF
jgi:hypothetical protein